jgi:hypothetical protein
VPAHPGRFAFSNGTVTGGFGELSTWVQIAERILNRFCPSVLQPNPHRAGRVILECGSAAVSKAMVRVVPQCPWSTVSRTGQLLAARN